MCTEADPPSPEEADAAIRCMLAVLGLFDALTNSGEGHRTASQIPTYFVHSLVWYLEHSVPLVAGWQTRSV